MDDTWNLLYKEAMSVINPSEISENIYVGSVGAALMTRDGNIYKGVCIDTSCSLGMCAERNAISTMITHGETEIAKIIAVYKDGNVMPPCGACREFMMQLKNGRQIEVMLNNAGKVKVLSDLMPDYYY